MGRQAAFEHGLVSKHVPLRLISTAALLWCGAAAAALAVALTSSQAYANGRVLEFQRQTAGPYEIALGTIPSPPTVGALHLSITVTDVEREAPVLDAVVTVLGTGPGEDALRAGPLEALNSPTDPVYYEATAPVESLGAWTFMVTVDGEPGKASANFILEVVELNPILQVITWVTVVLFFALVGLGLFPFVRDRLRRSRRRSRRR